MKTESKDLFEIIQSLTAAEKSYFKKYAAVMTHDSEADYMALFSAIAAQQVYNESELKAKFKNHAIGKNFSYNKLYLYQLILKVLRNYYEASDINSEIFEMLSGIQLLFRKGLFAQASKLNDKLEKISRDKFHFSGMLESLRWKDNFSNKQRTLSSNEFLLQNVKERIHIANNHLQYMSYYGIYREIISLVSQPFFGDKKNDFIKLEAIIKKPEMVAPSANAIPIVKMWYYVAKTVYAEALRDWKQAKLSNKRLIQIILTDNKLFQTSKRQLLDYLSNYVKRCSITNDIADAEFALSFIRSFNATDPFLKSLKFAYYYQNLTWVCLCNGNFNRYFYQANEANLFAKTFPDNINQLILNVFDFNASCINLLIGKTDECQRHINRLLNNANVKKMKDLEMDVFMIAVLLYIKKQDASLLKYYLSSALRGLKKLNQDSNFRFDILNFVKQHFVNENFIELNGAFPLLKAQLKLKFGRAILSETQTFNYYTWIESVTGKKSYEQLIRMKQGKGITKTITLKQFLK